MSPTEPDSLQETAPAEQLRRLYRSLTVQPVGAPGGDLFQGEAVDDWDEGRIFGGLIVAQVVNAGTATVPPERRPHSLHGYFLRPVGSGQIEFRVSRVRDGKTFSTREIAASQNGKTVCSMTMSFHSDEEGDEYQIPMAGDIPSPDEVPTQEDEGPEPREPLPFDARWLGATDPGPDGTRRSTHRAWYRTAPRLPDDPRLHSSVLAYFSDWTGSGGMPTRLEAWETTLAASLDHAIWFHRPARADEWVFVDVQALIQTGGRSYIRGTMHTEDGKLVLSMAQELLIRALG